MKITMLTGLSGPELSLARGDEHDCAQDEAIRLIEAGFAVPVAETKPERKVKAPPVETRRKGN